MSSARLSVREDPLFAAGVERAAHDAASSARRRKCRSRSRRTASARSSSTTAASAPSTSRARPTAPRSRAGAPVTITVLGGDSVTVTPVAHGGRRDRDELWWQFVGQLTVALAVLLGLLGIFAAMALFARNYIKVPPSTVAIFYGRKHTLIDEQGQRVDGRLPRRARRRRAARAGARAGRLSLAQHHLDSAADPAGLHEGRRRGHGRSRRQREDRRRRRLAARRGRALPRHDAATRSRASSSRRSKATCARFSARSPSKRSTPTARRSRRR